MMVQANMQLSIWKRLVIRLQMEIGSFKLQLFLLRTIK